MPKILRICEQCHTPFAWNDCPSTQQHGGGKYCSMTCRTRAGTQTLGNCKYCHSAFLFYDCPANQKKGGGQFCSKPCVAAYKTLPEEHHKKKRTGYSATWRHRNPERVLQNGRNWRHNNRERLREIKRVWNKANQEKVSRQKRASRQRHPPHPDKIRNKNARRKARRLAAPRNDFTVAQWQTMKDLLHSCCVYCERHMERLTMDHLTAFTLGGSHTLWNILPACRSCNSRKHTGTVLRPVQPFLLLP